MRVKAILKGNKIVFPSATILKRPEIEVEVEVPDEDIRFLTEEELDKMDIHELAKLIWKGKNVDQRDYKEIVGDALAAHYRGEIVGKRVENKSVPFSLFVKDKDLTPSPPPCS